MCRRSRPIPEDEWADLQRILADAPQPPRFPRSRDERQSSISQQLRQRVHLLRAIAIDLRLAPHGIVAHDRRTGIDSFFACTATAERLITIAALQALRVRARVERDRVHPAPMPRIRQSA